MKWNRHSDLEGLHAFLSPSKYHWINYDTAKFDMIYDNHEASERGTRLHAFAATAIELGQKLPKTNKTLNMYVNDAIGFKMDPEVLLFYSGNCFGTADAISFRNNKLRIHDLKTGTTPVHIEQLLIYAALFCLEYKVKPGSFETELRIYQNDEILYHKPEPREIEAIIEKIIFFDKRIMKRREMEG